MQKQKQSELTEETNQRYLHTVDLRPLFLFPVEQTPGWIRAIAHHQDQLPLKSQERIAFHLGEEFRVPLDVVASVGYHWTYSLPLVLTYLFHSPWARTKLRRQDRLFLDIQFARLADHFLNGVKPDGTAVASIDDAKTIQTIHFAFSLLHVYHAQWMFDPEEEAQKPYEELCAPLFL